MCKLSIVRNQVPGVMCHVSYVTCGVSTVSCDFSVINLSVINYFVQGPLKIEVLRFFIYTQMGHT